MKKTVFTFFVFSIGNLSATISMSNMSQLGIKRSNCTHKEIIQNAIDLRDIYGNEENNNRSKENILPSSNEESNEEDELNKFPGWAIGFIKKEELYTEFSKKTEIYFGEKVKKNLVPITAIQRDLINLLASRKNYKRRKLNNSFGWDESSYTTHFKKEKEKSLAPNIGIYCYVPYKPFNLKTISCRAHYPPVDKCEKCNKAKREKYSTENFEYNEKKCIHIYNAIGYAFDSDNQEDTRYFLTKKNKYYKADHFYTCNDYKIHGAKKNELINCYVNIFSNIFCCGCKKPINEIIISGVGTVNFAGLYPGNFLSEIFLPAFRIALQNWKHKLKAAGVNTISYIDVEPNNPIKNIVENEVVNNKKFESNSYGRFPEVLEDPRLRDRLKEVMIVNAWDPHSIVGNGNAIDESLDGYIGRNTAVGILCWPLTNMYMLNNIVVVDSIQNNNNVNLSSSASNKDNTMQNEFSLSGNNLELNAFQQQSNSNNADFDEKSIKGPLYGNNMGNNFNLQPQSKNNNVNLSSPNFTKKGKGFLNNSKVIVVLLISVIVTILATVIILYGDNDYEEKEDNDYEGLNEKKDDNYIIEEEEDNLIGFVTLRDDTF